MAESFMIKKSDGSFWPAYEEDQEKLKRVKVGEAIRMNWVKPRNFKNHKRFFAMLKLTIQNMPEEIPDRYLNIDFLRPELLIGIGHCERRESLGGHSYIIPKSMAFDKMGEDEFDELYRLASNYLLKHFLRDMAHEVFEENLELFM